MAARERSYLERHGNQWRVTVKVPPNARIVLGRSHLKYPLGTDNLARANLLKMDFVQQARNEIEAALSGVTERSASLSDEARILRRTARVRREVVSDPLTDSSYVEEVNDAAEAAVERAEQIEREEGFEAAIGFFEAATGKALPIPEYIEAFISDRDTNYVPKSVLDLRRAVDRLQAWLRQTSRPATLQTITRPVAQEYLRTLRENMGRKSFSKYRSFLSSYWDWMAEQEYVPEGASLWELRVRSYRRKRAHLRSGEAGSGEEDGGKRPFTRGELLTLLSGTPSRDHLTDLIRIAALSGMRIEEIYGLRVQDCADGVFSIRGGKTASAARRVPIHSGLVGIVERLTEGAAKTDYMIDRSTEVVKKTGLRSGAVGKAFTRYRRDCGVDERPNDKPKSNVDFHSLRRWFVTEAEAALGRGATGYTPMTIADVVGHETSSLARALPMTMGLYRGKADEQARRACVEAVRLPVGAGD